MVISFLKVRTDRHSFGIFTWKHVGTKNSNSKLKIRSWLSIAICIYRCRGCIIIPTLILHNPTWRWSNWKTLITLELALLLLLDFIIRVSSSDDDLSSVLVNISNSLQASLPSSKEATSFFTTQGTNFQSVCGGVHFFYKFWCLCIIFRPITVGIVLYLGYPRWRYILDRIFHSKKY